MIAEDKFLAFAKRIMIQNGLPEEESRTAIGRAYYSLYHITASVLRKRYSFQLIEEIRKVYPRRRIDYRRLNRLDKQYLMQFNMHKIFYLTLFELGHRTIAFQFKDFRSKRNDADYDLNLNFSETYSRVIVSEIGNLVETIGRL